VKAKLIFAAAVTILLAGRAAGAVAPWTFENGVHATVESRVGRAATESVWSVGGDRTLTDLTGTLRPLWSAESGSFRLNVDLQVFGQLGDTIQRANGATTVPFDSEGRDLVDFSRTWSDGSRHKIATRIDRLAASWTEPWGTITAGRHAATWGGGLVFNPFDLFNPFAPGDVVRDYKIGADMLHVDVPLTDGGFQALAVGRRDAATGSIAARASSFAAQWQRAVGLGEVFVMGGLHYDEPVIGAGISGLLGAAAWRIDGTWQRVQPEGSPVADDAVSAVANLQYSWVWAGKNVYGFLEYHYNGWGESDTAAALLDPLLSTQIQRGNTFVLGRHYAAASAQVELHPLLSLFVSSIVNLDDPSLLLQPRFNWSVSSQTQLTLGLDIPIGSTGTEFGGIELGSTGRTTRAPTTAYCLATWDF